MTQGTQIQELLGLKVPAVAIAFRDAAPAGITRVTSPAPAGCGYWKLAAEGKIFYTEASDHYTCPVGAHTHGVDLPPQVATELNGLVQTMVGMQYLTMAEIPMIPRRQETFHVAVYAPLTAGHLHSRRGAGPRDRQAADAAGGGGTVRGCGRRWRDDGTTDLRRASGITAIGQHRHKFWLYRKPRLYRTRR